MSGSPRFIWTDEVLRQVETLAGYGLTQEKICAVLGISRMTLTRGKKNTEKLSDALARGQAKGEAAAGRSLFDRVKDGDVGAIKWYEMTRCGRWEASRHDVTQETTVKVRVVPHAE